MTNESGRKKELQSQYKEREVVGGVYLLRNTQTRKIFLDATVDLQGAKNRFAFAQSTGSCVYVKLQQDWARLGGDRFAFETLEEVRKKGEQTREGFKEDVELLKDIWLEQLSNEEFY